LGEEKKPPGRGKVWRENLGRLPHFGNDCR